MKKILLILFTMILIVSCGNSNQGIYVSKEEFGDKWPFTVQDGYVYSVKRMVAVFKHNGIEYALNGFAKMYSKKHKKGYKDIVGIWKDDSKFPGTKISIGFMINLANENPIK